MKQSQAAHVQPFQRMVEFPSTLVQLFAQWGRETMAQHPSNADKFDDRDLDQRVRESGEW